MFSSLLFLPAALESAWAEEQPLEGRDSCVWWMLAADGDGSDLLICKYRWGQTLKEEEADLSQWCPVNRQEAMGTH